MKVKIDHRSKFSNLSNWKEEAWKNQGFNRIRTCDLRDTGAMLYQLSYEATHIGSEVKLLSSYLPVQWNDVKFIWNNSYLYCSCTCRWKWRVIIAVNFPIWAIGKKKPEKKQAFNGIGTCHLCDTGAMLYQLRLLLSNCLNWKIYCDDQSSLSSITVVQIWIISYKLHIISLHGKDRKSVV